MGTSAEPDRTGEEKRVDSAPETDFEAMLGSMTVEEFEELHQRASDRDRYLDHLQRKQAEIENLTKRGERQRREATQFANQGLITGLLPVLDNLQQGVAGLQLVLTEAERVLAELGLDPIVAKGERFDPNLHEAVMQEEVEGYDDMTIVQEFVRGYRLNDRVIRPSKVKVARKPAARSDSEPSEIDESGGDQE